MFAKIFKTTIGLLLVPLAVGVARAFYAQISDGGMFSGVLGMMEHGILAYLLFHVLVIRPVYIYVLGHELVHVLATWMCLGKVVSFKITRAGGNVVTSKTNFFIELSPYFIPIYTVFLGAIFLALKALGNDALAMSNTFVFLIGFTMAMHFIMTVEVLKIEQSDILKSGIVFSAVIIFVANLVITMAVFSPMFEEISFMAFIENAKNFSIEAYMAVYNSIMELVARVQTARG